MATAQVLFLPWLRQGLAARLANPDTLSTLLPASTDLSVTLGVTTPANNPSATVRMRGPGDVIGIDPRQVVRTEPSAGSTDFEALDLAAIEFDNPDLPWLFTPAAADAQGRLRPWLCLVVVRQQDGVRLRPAGSEALPVLEINAPAKPGDELPDLAESWAWAHAQVGWPHDAPPDETTMRTLLATRPELSVSRLLCARRLAAFTDYIACVVPTFEVGRLSGLNLPLPANADLTPAWRSGAAAAASVTLPVYYHWAFRTGAREDFETIVDRLAPRDLSGGVGHRPMDIGRPGFAFTATPGTLGRIALEGALQPVGMAREAVTTAVGPSWQTELQRIVNAGAETSQPSGGGDPLVGPPIYGRWLAARDRIELGAATPTWLDDLNLDPRERVAAGLGTRVIQAQQDELVAQAWAQAGEIAAANQRRRQTQLAAAIGNQLLLRHVTPFTQGAPGQDDVLWRLAAPAQARLMLTTPNNTQASMLSLVAQTSAAAATLSAPMRRLTRNRGALARRSALLRRKIGAAAATTPLTGQLFIAFAQPGSMVFTLPPARGFVSIDDVSLRMALPNADLLFRNMTDDAVVAAPRRPAFAIGAEPLLLHVIGAPATTATTFAPRLRIPGDGGGPLDPPDPVDPVDPPPHPPHPPHPPPVDSADAAAFRAAARRHLQLTNPAPLPIFVGQFVVLSQLLTTQRFNVQAQLDPGPALQLRLQATVATPDAPAATPPSISGALGAVPRYAMPASEALARLSQDWLLPGLHNVPADTVALLETNPRFIEAFMLGLNVEMTRELVWRDFPLAHELGTYFERFWRAARAGTPADIAPIVDWGTRRLGKNAPANAAAKPLVLLLRSALLQRYPGTAVYAVRGVADGARRKPPAGAGEEKAPLFRGALEPDVSFFGFDLDVNEAIGNPGWYFVLQQQPTEPRFGFDNGVDFGGTGHVSVNVRPSGMTLPATTPWAANAAQLAHAIRQLPVRVMIHASELLPTPVAGPALTTPVPPAPPAPTPPRPPRPPRPPVVGPLPIRPPVKRARKRTPK